MAIKEVVCVDSSGTELEDDVVYEVVRELGNEFYAIKTEDGEALYEQYRFRNILANGKTWKDVKTGALEFLDMFEERDK
jgi:hypothetical protein